LISLSGEGSKSPCVSPKSPGISQKAGTFLLKTYLGTKSYNQFPIWGHIDDGHLVQVVTPSEISLYRDISSISIPAELNVDDDDNPIVILYKLKN